MSDEVYIELIRAFGPTILALTGLIALILQQRKTHRKVEGLDAQMHPNGGSSMRDSLNRLEQKVEGIGQTLSDHISEDKRRLRRYRCR